MCWNVGIPPAACFDRNNLLCVCSQFAGCGRVLLLCVHVGNTAQQNSQSCCKLSKGQGLLGNDAQQRWRTDLYCIVFQNWLQWDFISSTPKLISPLEAAFFPVKNPWTALKCLDLCLCWLLRRPEYSQGPGASLLWCQPGWCHCDPPRFTGVYLHPFIQFANRSLFWLLLTRSQAPWKKEVNISGPNSDFSCQRGAA